MKYYCNPINIVSGGGMNSNKGRAVMQAYGFPIKGFRESNCAAELMKPYQKLTSA